MITKFKIFEYLNTTEFPELGDYVIINAERLQTEEHVIGHIYAKVSDNSMFYVEYKLDDDIHQKGFYRYNFLAWSKNKEDLIEYLFAKKYNL